MRWDDVVAACMAAIVADPTLYGIHGEDVRLAGAVEEAYPGIACRLIDDSVQEQWEPCVLQWDIWTESHAELRASERALRRLFDVGEATIGGVYMISEYIGGQDLGQLSMGPDKNDHYGRAVRFQHRPISEALRAGRST